MTATLLNRITHQFRTEWRHHRVWVFAWAAWTLLQRYYGSVNDDNLFYNAFWGFGPLMMLLLPATVAWRCTCADSPSNTDCMTLTRPIGQTALWLGKIAFLFCGIVLPLLIVESTGWAGFQFGIGAWLALGSGVMLYFGLVIGTVSALTALTSTTRQVIALAVLGVLAAGLWLTGGGSVMQWWSSAKSDAAVEALKVCGGIVASVVAFFGVIAAWWLATVSRRRAIAAVVLVISVMQVPLVSAMWKVDWITPPALAYPSTKLGVKTGKADPADKAPGRGLWPTLRITGLGKDEVASVIDFAPIMEGKKEWPPLGSYSDLVPNTNGYDSWLHLDHLRALLKHSAPNTLWWHQLYNNTFYNNGRPKIQEAIKPLHLDPKAMPARWRLRLAVHEMRRIGTVPLKELWEKGVNFPVRPGLRVEFPPVVPSFFGWESKGCLHRVYSLVLPPREHRPAESRGQPLADGFLLVLEDPELRENKADDLGPHQHDYSRVRSQGFALQADESQGFELRFWTPVVQHYLLKTTHEEWVNRLNASLWHAEERGTVEIELTAAQMAEVLAEPQPQPKTEVKKP